jgi:methyl-accepting chemotaxis protein
MAGKMSTGDLETPVMIQSRDEIGELARSLERMRASLKAAMIRGLDENLTAPRPDPPDPSARARDNVPGC